MQFVTITRFSVSSWLIQELNAPFLDYKIMHKIAIIKAPYEGSALTRDYIKSGLLVQSITDWAEVSAEDLKILRVIEQRNQYTSSRFFILEQPASNSAFVQNTVSAYLIQAEAERKKILAAEAKRKKEAEEKAAKLKAKKEAEEKKKLADLLKKHGMPSDPTPDELFPTEATVKPAKATRKTGTVKAKKYEEKPAPSEFDSLNNS